MRIIIRPAGVFDAAHMADLINQIGAAQSPEKSRGDIAKWMTQNANHSAWHVAEDEAGNMLGFQWIAPHPDLPAEAAEIATFVKSGDIGLRAGSKLFEATKAAAKKLGYHWINATVQSNNSGGQIYYQSRGFENWRRSAQLPNLWSADNISKRFDLR